MKDSFYYRFIRQNEHLDFEDVTKYMYKNIIIKKNRLADKYKIIQNKNAVILLDAVLETRVNITEKYNKICDIINEYSQKYKVKINIVDNLICSTAYSLQGYIDMSIVNIFVEYESVKKYNSTVDELDIAKITCLHEIGHIKRMHGKVRENNRYCQIRNLMDLELLNRKIRYKNKEDLVHYNKESIILDKSIYDEYMENWYAEEDEAWKFALKEYQGVKLSIKEYYKSCLYGYYSMIKSIIQSRYFVLGNKFVIVSEDAEDNILNSIEEYEETLAI